MTRDLRLDFNNQASAAPLAGSQKLRRLERLLCSSNFKKVLRSGKCFRSPALRIHYLENGQGFSRLGLVVSRKVGHAPRRNRVKRQLREVFRKAKRQIPRSLDLVIIPEPSGPPRSSQDYAHAFQQFLSHCRAVLARASGASRP
ncbi:MAG: ribonuclease P protein component [Planctomycetes bacterium]|nr:ribonuclease P protein component [Planctomycetota bacterium]